MIFESLLRCRGNMVRTDKQADLAAAMGLRVTELSKGIEKLQDSGFVTWKTDREAGRTYVELSSKAVELMAEEQALLQRCYRRMPRCYRRNKKCLRKTGFSFLCIKPQG